MQPSVARMNDEYFTPSQTHSTDKVAHKVIAFDLVNSNAVFHGDWDAHCIAHRFDAICNRLRLVHQACAKRTALHTVTWATTIQIDFVVAILLAEFGGIG